MIHPQLEHAGESAWPFARVARYACGTIVAPASALAFDVDSAEGVSGSAGVIAWDLDQFRGTKNPSQNGTSAPFRDAPVIQLDKWPYLDTSTGGAIPASFSVAWQCNGKSLGNVRIANTAANGAPSPLRVTARIVDAEEADPQTAAMRIRFEYRFARDAAPEAVATTEIRLYGNGTYDQSSRWQQN